MRAAYTLAVGSWGIQPGQFWDMSLRDWGWLFEVKRPQRTGNWAGGMTDATVMELSRALDDALEARANGKN